MDSLNQYITLYRDHAEAVCDHAPEVLNRPRPEAFKALAGIDLPRLGAESYDVTSLPDILAPDYGVNINRVAFGADKVGSRQPQGIKEVVLIFRPDGNGLTLNVKVNAKDDSKNILLQIVKDLAE